MIEYLDVLAVEKAMAFFLIVFLMAAVGSVVERMRGRDGKHLSSGYPGDRLRRGGGGVGEGGPVEAGRGDDLAKGGRVALTVAPGGRKN